MCFAVVLGAAAPFLGCGATERTSAQARDAGRTVDEATLTRLRGIGRRLAEESGDASAQGRKAVLTTAETAERLFDTRLGPGERNRPVYVIWMYGNFRRDATARPLGYLLVGVVGATSARLMYSRVVPGELHPGLPNPEKLGLPEVSLSGDVKARAPDAEKLERLRELARNAARRAGESEPEAEYFATNEQDADAAMSGGEVRNGNPDAPAYLLVMRGRFRNDHFGPGAPPPPPSRFLLLTVPENDDLRIATQAWTNRPPDTSRLGEPAMLLGS